MATGAETRAALAYASSKGYTEGEGYSAEDMGLSFTDHRGHGGVTYDGISNGHLAFRCRCGDTVFVLPGSTA